MMEKSQLATVDRKRESLAKLASEKWKNQMSFCKAHLVLSPFFLGYVVMEAKRFSVHHSDQLTSSLLKKLNSFVRINTGDMMLK